MRLDRSTRERSRRKAQPARSPWATTHPTSPRARLPRNRAGTGPSVPALTPATEIVRGRVRLRLPAGLWLRTLSERHPGIPFEIVDRLEVGRGRTIIEVRYAGRRDLTEEVARDRRVESVENPSTETAVRRMRVLARGPTLVPIHRRHRVLRQFPFSVRAGRGTWTVVGPRRNVSRLLRELARRDLDLHVLALRRGPPPPPRPLLTDRQQEILHRAVLAGYYEVPRRISQTELARIIGVAPSTLCVTLARIERSILTRSRGP